MSDVADLPDEEEHDYDELQRDALDAERARASAKKRSADEDWASRRLAFEAHRRRMQNPHMPTLEQTPSAATLFVRGMATLRGEQLPEFSARAIAALQRAHTSEREEVSSLREHEATANQLARSFAEGLAASSILREDLAEVAASVSVRVRLNLMVALAADGTFVVTAQLACSQPAQRLYFSGVDCAAMQLELLGGRAALRAAQEEEAAYEARQRDRPIVCVQRYDLSSHGCSLGAAARSRSAVPRSFASERARRAPVSHLRPLRDTALLHR